MFDTLDPEILYFLFQDGKRWQDHTFQNAYVIARVSDAVVLLYVCVKALSVSL